MKLHPVVVGIFVAAALLIFGVGLFLIGDQHKAFHHRITLYTGLADVNGLQPGAQVRVSGFTAGQITHVIIPDRPSGKFRLEMSVDAKLEPVIRQDSFVTIESDGLVGDKFVLIHNGTDGAPRIADGSTLRCQEPVELSAVIAKATGLIDQANTAIGSLTTEINGTLDTANGTLNTMNGTIRNANGLITSVRSGQGAVGMLLSDKQTQGDVRDAITHTKQVTANLDQVSVQAKNMLSDFQSRNLPAKTEQTLNNAQNASQQLDQVSVKLNATLDDMLGPDQQGQTAADNLRETFSNINVATANTADDTEALKHEFLFRGFFKKRGFYSLSELTPAQYRATPFFSNPANARTWMSAQDTFATTSGGHQVLSMAGTQQIDQLVSSKLDGVIGQPIVIEGYSGDALPAEQIRVSRERALAVKSYLERHFHLAAKDIGTMALEATPPSTTGKSSWDGVCIVLLAKAK